jgi:hypothetical protein
MEQNDFITRVQVVRIVRWLALSLLVSLLAVAMPVVAQFQSGISSPASGDTISGVVVVQGTANHESFLRYEVAFDNGNDWIVFAEGEQPVVEGTLAVWDTTVGQPQNPVFPDGTYRLRLRVVRQDYNYDEYFVENVIVSNSGTPTPTPSPTAEGDGTPDAAATVSTQVTLPAAEGTPNTTLDFGRPDALPTLTPFPTPSPEGASSSEVASGDGVAPPPVPPGSGEGGLLQRVVNVNTERFSNAFWIGVRFALVLFALLPLYLILRAIVRRAWRELLVWLERR